MKLLSCKTLSDTNFKSIITNREIKQVFLIIRIEPYVPTFIECLKITKE